MTSTLTAEELAKLNDLADRVTQLEVAARGHQSELQRINAEASGLVAALRKFVPVCHFGGSPDAPTPGAAAEDEAEVRPPGPLTKRSFR